MAQNKQHKKAKKQPSWLGRAISKRHKSKKAFIFWAIKVALLLIVWLAFILSAALVYYAHDLPDISIMAQHDRKPQITIYGADEVILAKYGDLRGDTLTYSQIPTNLIQAIITAEDRRFFNHIGIDVLGILRAYSANLLAGKVVQGGSTITQQLAKIIYLSPERTFKRKIQEMLIAFQLERNFSKEQIIAMYVNRVYMGRGSYGMDAAAEYYFGKSIEDITPFECAILASMLKAPTKYAAANNRKLVIDRARYILQEMAEQGYITTDEMRKATPPKFIERGAARGVLKNPYFSDFVLSQVQELVDNPNQDLKVYTTLDVNAQATLEHAAEKVMAENAQKHHASQVAAIAMEPSGAIKAMIGGRSYDGSQYNRAVMAKRQPGSAFKIFVYLAALEDGFTPHDTFEDKPISYSQGKGLPLWTPKNFKNEFRGEMTLSEAFTNSINTVTVQLSEKVGRAKVIHLAKRLGVESSLPNLPSIALGAADLTLLEMTQALAHIANDGIKVRAFAILQIRNANNEVIYEHPGLPTETVIDDSDVATIQNMMRDVVDHGTGRAAKLPGKISYGKTGTTQDHRDAWFIGASDKLVAGIWVGNDDNTPMKGVVGGSLPASIWKGFMENVAELKTTTLPKDSLPWSNKSIFDNLFNPKEETENNAKAGH
jgi:penicillin-binding protein 1A